ncbi:MAG: HD domain-containing phosphohydrolase [Bacillota bacterium]
MQILLAMAESEHKKDLMRIPAVNTGQYRLITCTSAIETLKKVLLEHPAVVMLDQKLVETGNRPLFRQIKELDQSCYIILLASGDATEMQAFYPFLGESIDDLLIRPSSPVEIEARLQIAQYKISNRTSVPEQRDNRELKDIEQALKEERDFISAINDTIGSLVVVLDLQGRIISINRACRQITGYTYAEVRDRFYWDVFLELEERELARTFFIALRPGDFPYEMENTWVMKDGSKRRIFCSNTAVLDEGGSINYHITTGVDVTEWKQVEENLRETNEKLSALIHASPLAVIALNPQGQVTSWSSAAEKTFGWAERMVLGQPPPMLAAEEMNSFRILCADAFKGKTFSGREFHCLRRDGSAIYASISAAPLRNHTGAVTGIMLIADNITERRQTEEQLRFLSFHDRLTGLYNRAYFEEELKRLNTIRQLPLSIIIGDVNNLKLVNDTFGHGAGDKFLRAIARILQDSCRKEDVICRWGGDEFAILLPKTNASVAWKICERIKDACTVTGGLIPLSISLGVVTKDDEKQQIDELLNEAENRMYRSKILESKGARSSVISALQKALAEKTNETEEHALRLQSNALQLGYSVNLSLDELDELTLLCALHDIGMIALPDHIIKNEGILTEEEREMMQQHCEIGYRIVKSIPDLAHLAEKILAHHERWDGNGYPQGFKGEEIPLVSRIISLVDAYEAMTFGRPYKKPHSSAEALAELQQNAGSQFDPRLVDKFTELLSADS